MFAEVLDDFFDTNDFAVVATWNGTAAVDVIFDKAYVSPLGDLVEGSGPVAQCPAASVPGVKHSDTLAIDGATYKVRGVEPDGTGLVMLRLEKQG